MAGHSTIFPVASRRHLISPIALLHLGAKRFGKTRREMLGVAKHYFAIQFGTAMSLRTNPVIQIDHPHVRETCARLLEPLEHLLCMLVRCGRIAYLR